ITLSGRDSVSFQFDAGPNIGRFKGLFEGDTTINGTYYQAGRDFPFKLRSANPNTHHQYRPYHHKVLISQNDSLAIGGTLTWPKNISADQLVITLSGSGAHNRDEAIFGFKIFGTIADYLTRHGIAVFRFDDRGIGQSTGNLANTTLEMLADDVGTIMNYFSQQQDSIPSFQNITLLGHSKGGLVGGIAAEENSKVDKLILMSSPGLPQREVLKYQYSRIIKKGPFTEEQKQHQIAAIKKMIKAVAKESEDDKTKENYNNKQISYMKRLPDSVQSSLKTEVHSYNLTTAATKITETRLRVAKESKKTGMLTYNPVKDLTKVNIPVLVLFGGKDVQVTAAMNKEPIKQALQEARVPYEFNIFPDANHLYQHTQSKDAPYSTLKDEFVDGFLETITDWIKA